MFRLIKAFYSSVCNYSFSFTNLLSDLISVHCAFDVPVSDGGSKEDEMVDNLTSAILAAEEQLGISKTLIG